MNIEEINKTRLKGWEATLNGLGSTGMVMVGIGHNDTLGQITVLAPEDVALGQIATMLEGVAAGIRKGLIKLN
jgi:hypothetical protein